MGFPFLSANLLPLFAQPGDAFGYPLVCQLSERDTVCSEIPEILTQLAPGADQRHFFRIRQKKRPDQAVCFGPALIHIADAQLAAGADRAPNQRDIKLVFRALAKADRRICITVWCTFLLCALPGWGLFHVASKIQTEIQLDEGHLETTCTVMK